MKKKWNEEFSPEKEGEKDVGAQEGSSGIPLQKTSFGGQDPDQLKQVAARMSFRANASLNEDELAEQSLTNIGKVAVDENGKEGKYVVVALDKDEMAKGYHHPFTVITGANFDRDAFHESVLRFLAGGGIADEKLRRQFEAWYCEQFNQDQSVFKNPETLKAAILELESRYERKNNARETLVPSKPVPKVPLVQSDRDEKEGQDADESTNYAGL